MEALKIVCNHHDTPLIKENKILKEKIKKVELIFKKMNDAFFDILWVSRKARTKEEFMIDYEDIENREELWKKCVDTKEKYKTIFNKLEADLDDEEIDFIKYVENYNTLMGVIGGIRSITSMYEEVMNPYKYEEKECEICDVDCECYICGKCVYKKCKCPHYLIQLEEELFALDLNLDS